MSADPWRPVMSAQSTTAPPFAFRVEARCPHTRARRGVFTTPHGDVPTPAFMPVGTRGTVKGVMPRDAEIDIDLVGNRKRRSFVACRPDHAGVVPVSPRQKCQTHEGRMHMVARLEQRARHQVTPHRKTEPSVRNMRQTRHGTECNKHTGYEHDENAPDNRAHAPPQRLRVAPT